MSERVKPSRPYRSAVRAEQARRHSDPDHRLARACSSSAASPPRRSARVRRAGGCVRRRPLRGLPQHGVRAPTRRRAAVLPTTYPRTSVEHGLGQRPCCACPIRRTPGWPRRPPQTPRGPSAHQPDPRRSCAPRQRQRRASTISAGEAPGAHSTASQCHRGVAGEHALRPGPSRARTLPRDFSALRQALS